MERDLSPVFNDILTAIDRIGEIATGHRDSVSLEEPWRGHMAVQCGLEIISEASRRLPSELKETRPEIPWHKVRAFGNVVRHEYDHLHVGLIWSVITTELPKLRIAVVAIREAHP